VIDWSRFARPVELLWPTAGRQLIGFSQRDLQSGRMIFALLSMPLRPYDGLFFGACCPNLRLILVPTICQGQPCDAEICFAAKAQYTRRRFFAR
jgi:hypothetical protein